MQVSLKQVSQVFCKPTAEFETIEYNALRFSGLSIPAEICSYDIPIGNDTWMHQIRCGSNNKEDIVLLPGYGGTSMTFVRLFKDLSIKYRVHALDLLGTGLSNRAKFNDEASSAEAIFYHINAIQSWRRATGIQFFTIAGHSYGGFLSSAYAKHYPNRVSRLILISPPGVNYNDDQISKSATAQLKSEASFGKKIVFSVAKKFIDKETTPSQALGCKLIGGMIMNKVLEGRFGLSGEEKSAWKAYMKTITDITPNSEKSFHRIFYLPSLGCQESISQMLVHNRYSFPVQFYFGDSDWMEKQVAWELANKKAGGNAISYRIIQGAGHQIIFDNPQKMAAYILKGTNHNCGF